MDYEIRVVANGYLVQPAFAMNRGHSMYEPKDMHVFNTARETADWLCAQLEADRAKP